MAWILTSLRDRIFGQDKHGLQYIDTVIGENLVLRYDIIDGATSYSLRGCYISFREEPDEDLLRRYWHLIGIGCGTMRDLHVSINILDEKGSHSVDDPGATKASLIIRQVLLNFTGSLSQFTDDEASLILRIAKEFYEPDIEKNFYIFIEELKWLKKPPTYGMIASCKSAAEDGIIIHSDGTHVYKFGREYSDWVKEMMKKE